MCNKTYDWDVLPFYKLSYNDSKHWMIGFKPADLFFGWSIRILFTNFKDPEFTTYIEFRRNIKKRIAIVRKEALSNVDRSMEDYTKNLHRKPIKLSLHSEIYLKALRGHNTFEQKFDMFHVRWNRDWNRRDSDFLGKTVPISPSRSGDTGQKLRASRDGIIESSEVLSDLSWALANIH